jgi:hypothetical protein
VEWKTKPLSRIYRMISLRAGVISSGESTLVIYTRKMLQMFHKYSFLAWYFISSLFGFWELFSLLNKVLKGSLEKM